MTRKQKKVLVRILAAAALLLIAALISALSPWQNAPLVAKWLPPALFLLPYLTIGYDILIKAVRGVAKG